MRRFITSLPGKVISNVLVLALLLPSISLALAARAEAQVTVLPSWAVIKFKNLKSPGTNFGQVAADAVSGELLKTGQYEVVSQETIDRAVKALGISVPTEGTTLMRLGQEVRATTVVTGEVANYQVINTGAGKMARATLRTVVYDVASGLPVNGAITTADSTTRPGDVSDETLINDALQSASMQAIHDIGAKNLPTGTILNTTTNEALINKGSRSGFTEGQEVIILRGREQVATGHVRSVDPDMSTVRVDRLMKGVQPGDKVRAIFSVPALVVGSDGSARPASTNKPHISSGFVTALLVVGLLAVLMSNSGSNEVLSSVTAEPTLDEAFQPAVQVSWSPNGFAKGNAMRTQWQVWRSDIVDSPVLAVDGAQTSALDRADTRSVTYTSFQTVNSTVCDQTSFNGSSAAGVQGVRAGRPYIYSVELIYSRQQSTTGGTSSATTSTATTSTATTSTATTSTATTSTATTTGGTATTGGTGTTGGTAGGTGGDFITDRDLMTAELDALQGTTGITGGGTTSTASTATGTTSTAGGTGTTGGGGTIQTCYFQSSRTVSRGQATPMNQPTQVSPAEGQSVGAPIQFTFNSAVGTTPIIAEYTIQFSDSILFPAARTYTFTSFMKNQTGVISTTAIDTSAASLPAYIRSASRVYWRVGARNPQDKPGPLPDPASRMRYIFSQPRSFVRPGGPPPPP